MTPQAMPGRSWSARLRAAIGGHSRTSLALAAGLVAVLACAGFLLADGVDRGRFAHLVEPGRIDLINAELAANTDAIVFFGDSHADFLARAGALCGRKPIDAGIGGISAAGYRSFLDKLVLPGRDRTGILSIGTNSARLKWLPRDVAAFRRNVEGLVSGLSTGSARILVLAIPPVSATEAPTFDRAALRDYGQSLQDLCVRQGCRFVDPYRDIRSADPIIARPGATISDGVHLSDYAAPLAQLAGAVCP